MRILSKSNKLFYLQYLSISLSFALIFNNLDSISPPLQKLPFSPDTSHFPPPFLSSSPPLLSLCLSSCFCSHSNTKHGSFVPHLHTVCTSETRKTPTPGAERRGVGLSSRGAGGGISTIYENTLSHCEATVMFSKHRRLHVGQEGKHLYDEAS